jgi:hypothetical protein
LRRAALFALVLAACNGGAPFEGLAPTVDRNGPKVVFEPLTKPFPEIPFPNDVATIVDQSARTGLRINVNLAAPTQLERNVRSLLDTLDGFGTFAPITVSFDRDIDFRDLYARQNDGDPTNDGVYLVDLLTGALTPVDLNGGHFPYALNNPSQYFINDPHTNAFNLLFPVDGPFPNFFNLGLPHTTVRQQSDDLVTFYEIATHTLIVRPIFPLQQEHRYAVVLTTRIKDTAGNPISSPWSGINHAAQTTELQPLLQHLPPGTSLSDIAVTWAFTTQSTTTDLELIRRGMRQIGPYASLALAYPVAAGDAEARIAALINVLQERGPFVAGQPGSPNRSDYILPTTACAAPPSTPNCLKALLDDPEISSLLVSGDPATIAALEDTLQYVDYLVSAAFVSPSFINTNSGAPQDQSFQIDPVTGQIRAQPEVFPFLLAVPKQVAAAGHVAPFPTVIAGHGYGSMRTEEVLGFGGTFAKFGLATIAIDAYGHGVAVDPALELLGRAKAAQYGLAAFADVFFTGRARDLDFDGIKESGGDFWTADAFHTRDTIRQTIVDWMQLVRLLRTFDGTTRMTIANITNAVAGDFNGDGVPDVAGAHTFPNIVYAPDGTTRIYQKGAVNPGADLFNFGVSLGGILSAILPAVEPEIVASVPVSAGGGLSDVALRTNISQVVQAVFLETFGPFVTTCGWSPSSGPHNDLLMPQGACNASAPDATPMLVMVVQDVNRERDIPIAPMTLAERDVVTVQNLSQAADCSAPGTQGCSAATADKDGNIRLPFSADWPLVEGSETDNPLTAIPDIQVNVISPGDSLRITIAHASGAPTTVLTTFQQQFTFYGVTYHPGDPLVSVARGYGYTRNTPAFRRLMGLSQLILEPGDPINYAPHYFQSPLTARLTPDPLSAYFAGPANVMVVATSGDPGVPISTGIALARAAGVVETVTPDPAYGMTDDQVLIKSGVVEGVAATDRFDDPNGGVFAAIGASHVQCDPTSSPPCSGDVLIDPTGYACDAGVCSDRLGAPRLVPPLRDQLTRNSSPPAPCPVSTRTGATGCYSIGASACTPNASGISGLMIPYLNRTGQHGFLNPQPGKPFDLDQFMANVVGRYFECRGRELHFDACQQGLASCPWIPQPPP